MTVEFVRSFFGWCALINYAVLIIWWLMFSFGRDWMRSVHGKWFEISNERFNEIHYQLMGWFKLLIFVFNLVPYLVLRFAI